MQKLEKITPSKSSDVNSPVISFNAVVVQEQHRVGGLDMAPGAFDADFFDLVGRCRAGRRCRSHAAARLRSGWSAATLSRVVPAIGVTMASSAPASALSSELLPALGWPAITTLMPSRSSAPWRARCITRASACCNAVQLALCVGLLQEVNLFLGEVERGLDQHAQVHQRVAQGVDFPRELARQRPAGTARRRLGAGVDQVGNGLGLRQVDLVVEKGALGELAGPRQPQTGQPWLARARVGSAPAARQRASSSCSTTGPPWACSSSTSSPVKNAAPGKNSASPWSMGEPSASRNGP
jgi:hypothetical protein